MPGWFWALTATVLLSLGGGGLALGLGLGDGDGFAAASANAGEVSPLEADSRRASEVTAAVEPEPAAVGEETSAGSPAAATDPTEDEALVAPEAAAAGEGATEAVGTDTDTAVPGPQVATLTVRVVPWNAEVEVDGERWSPPYRHPVPRSDQPIRVVARRRGFLPFEEDVVVSGDRTLRIRLRRPRAAPGISPSRPRLNLPRARSVRSPSPRTPMLSQRQGGAGGRGGFTTNNPY